MEGQIFSKDDIKEFEWTELDGKTLVISAKETDGVICVMGIEPKTKTIYLLKLGD